MAKQSMRDTSFSTDDQDCRTVVLDLADAPAKKPAPIDGEATVVLDLTPTQVHEMLTDGRPPAPKK